MSTKLDITEWFLSIQGEGRHTGLPCFFIRMAGCDLRCRYCDTTYAYGSGTKMEIDEIVSLVPKHIAHVQITGGEPLLQEEGLIELIDRLLAPPHDKTVLLETGGHQSLRNLPAALHTVMDIKLSGSSEADHDFAANFPYLKKTDEIKFVISNKTDFEEAVDWIRKYRLDEICELLISPVFDELSLATVAGWILDAELDVRLQTQLHKIIWGKEATGV